MIDITILIPLNKYSENIEKELEKALKSISSQKQEVKEVLIVTTLGIKEEIKLQGLKFHIHNEHNDIYTMINDTVKKLDTEYFSVLEFQDELTETSLITLKQFISCKGFTESDVILPMTLVYKDGKELMLVNDACWSQGFTSKLGYLDLNSTKDNDAYFISGAIIKTELFKKLNGFKSIPFLYGKEFLLRCLENKAIVTVIPKVSLKHNINHNDSVFDGDLSTLDKEEIVYYDKLIKNGEYKKLDLNFKKYSRTEK